MPKHTPGPWGLVTSGGEPYTVFVKDVSDPSKKICLFPVPQDRKESMANAHLIAAAPEMLDTLKKCVIAIEGLEKYGDVRGVWSGDEMLLETLRRVIDKAEGRE